MRIQFQQSGGLVPIKRPAITVDTDDEENQEARRWHDLVAAADFFNLPTSSPPRPGGDGFSYRITVEKDGKCHTIDTHRGAGPAALDALIEQLRRKGTHRPV